MRIWIDTEFNEFKGDLISIGMVADDGREFYEVTYCPVPGDWVAANVIPILQKQPIPILFIQAEMARFLSRYPDGVHIVADWPEDIKHFCELLITGPGMRLDTPPLTMEVIRIDGESELPHNALADARGIRAAHLAAEKAGA
jgi:hypothetical protein